jgi:hypothetical protein
MISAKTTCDQIEVFFEECVNDYIHVRAVCKSGIHPDALASVRAFLPGIAVDVGQLAARMGGEALVHVPSFALLQYICDVMHRANLAAEKYYNVA